MNGVDIFSQMSLMLSQLQAATIPNVGGGTTGNQQSFESMMSDKRTQSEASSSVQKPNNTQNTQTKPATDQETVEEKPSTQPEQPLSDEELEQRMALLGGMSSYNIQIQTLVPSDVQEQEYGLADINAVEQQSGLGVQQAVDMVEVGQGMQSVNTTEQQGVQFTVVSEQPQEQTTTQETTAKTVETVDQQSMQTVDKTQLQQQTNDSQKDETTQKDNSEPTDVQVMAGNAKEHISETEQPLIKVGDGETLDATKPEFDVKLAKQIETALDQGQQKVTVQLTPEHLGKITIEMSRSDSGLLNVVLRTENDQTAHLLREQTSALSNLLQHGGQDEVRVQVAQPQEAETQWKQPDQDQNGHNQQSHQQQKEKRDETEQFLQQLRLGLLNQLEIE